MISIAVRPSRYSHALIKRNGCFAVNIPHEKLLKETDYCGIVSGDNTDKFKACGFTMAPASSISSPVIKECPVNIECRVVKSLELGAHDVFIGEVTAVRADESVIDGSGRIDFKKAGPLVYNHGEYWNLGSKIGYYGFSSKK
jgi:flavin reductase (DIM6/NTAB) family NADH-FMN oxidoreductase RutF